MSHKVLFVCLFDIFIFLPEVIGRKIAHGRGKWNKKRRFVYRLRMRVTENKSDH